MEQVNSPFSAFVTRVHRRYALIHIVEQGVVGLALGALAGIILTAILLWRGLPSGSVAAATLLLGLALGLVRGAASRPTRIAAAAKADEQLRLADLLSSALLVSDQAGWAHVIRSQADAVCRKLSPWDVILHRLGVRSWGGAGLATALLGALALIPIGADSSLARQQGSEILAVGHDAELMRSGSLPRPTVVQADPDSAERSRYTDESSKTAQDQAAEMSGLATARPSLGNDAAGGKGTASSTVSDAARLAVHTGKNPLSDANTAADGAGIESNAGVRAESAGSSIAAGGTQPTPPPWKSDSWPNQVTRVRSNLQSGRLPDSYRDMLSGYFDAH